MEDSLDEISLGKVDYVEYLNNFYFGSAQYEGLEKKLEQEFDKNVSRLIMTVNCDDGKTSEIRIGRYGIYADKEGTRITLDDAIPPSEIMNGAIKELIEKKEAGPIEMGEFEETGEPILLKNGRFGPYVQSGKKMKSLLPGMTESEVTPEVALALIALPTNVGVWEEQDIKKDIGKFGPYIRCGKETRSIPNDINLLEITEEQAIILLKNDKKKGTSVLKELGDDIQLKDGRYGAYVTDGKINATLPKTLVHDDVTLEVAKKLIEEKRAKGPTKRRFKRKK
jgi:DNA topoisomerase-1